MSINLMSPVKVQGAASRGGAAVLLCSAAVAIILLISLSWVEQLQLWHALGLIGAGLGMFSGWARRISA